MTVEMLQPEDRRLKESDFWIFWKLWFEDEWWAESGEDYQDVVTLCHLGYLWAEGDEEDGLVVGLTDKARDLLRGMLTKGYDLDQINRVKETV